MLFSIPYINSELTTLDWILILSIFWNSNTLATSCKELTHWKRPWCWEGLWAGGEGDDGGWDGWMASPTLWTWVWVNSRSWWWTGRPGVLQSMGSQRVGHDWATELNWTDLRIGFLRGRSGGLVFPSLDEFSTIFVLHTIKGFGIVNKAEVDVFLELSCFFDEPTDVGNLISGSSASSKYGLNIWKFTVYVMLKPDLENFLYL